MVDESIEEIQQSLISDFSLFDDWADKYEYIIQIGKELPQIDEEFKTDDNIIRGCQSKVWLHAELKEGRVIFTADSDAIITRGLVGLIIRVLTNQTPAEIMNANLHFIDEIGLKEHLSSTRSNGLVAMIKQMKLFGLAFNTQEKQN